MVPAWCGLYNTIVKRGRGVYRLYEDAETLFCTHKEVCGHRRSLVI